MNILTIFGVPAETGLGLLAGTCTTIAYVPQLVKTWRSKSAQDLSWSMLITLWVGVLLWLAYGAYIQALPVILTNIVTLILSSLILILKLKYEHFPTLSRQDKSEV